MLTTSTLPKPFCIAQAIGLSGAACLSGTIFSLTYLTIPTLLTTHQTHPTAIPLTTLTHQWKTLYETGKRRVPPIALLTATTFLYLAWATRKNTTLAAIAPRGSSSTYVLSAALVLGIVPWTGMGIGGTNRKLMEWAERKDIGEGIEEKEAEEVVTGLMRKWAWLNGVRALWPLMGGLVGLGAVLP